MARSGGAPPSRKEKERASRVMRLVSNSISRGNMLAATAAGSLIKKG